MDIKIRARLSAYSKVDSMPSIDDIKIDSVPEQDIDTLFKGEPTETTVTKDEIDELFKDLTKDESVTKDEIDTLFNTTEVEDTVDKEEIDTLFTNEEEEPVSVTFAEIDSLFK